MGFECETSKHHTTDLTRFSITDSPREAVAIIRKAREQRTKAYPLEAQRD